jgi:transcriptional regulator of acetoin/glycerol metabolism
VTRLPAALHISETAHAPDISRKSLWEKMRKHAIAAEPLH